MKKTLITLLALASSAMGAEQWTLSTKDDYGTSNEGGSYAGIVFTLAANNTERFSVVDGTQPLSTLVALNSITLLERANNDIVEGRVLYLTDANNVFLGASSVFTKAEGSNEAVFNFSGDITLTSSATYYAYISTSDSVANWVAGETTVPGGQYYSAQLAAVGGSYTTSASSDWGLLNAQKGLASTGFAPVMSISVSEVVVPEPTTATLSLLALAGLAVRRRRR